ncbi:MAG: SLC45 family MFS transporter [Bacteroidetes bacterium]|nr:SLC45 family MFS transporter [Bacteroidota bacterium]
MNKSKQPLQFWQIWNMSFGFLGIQFGFALQGGFMSRIFQALGAAEKDIPMLWIAAPLTGLIVQPIIGYMSDRTWHPRLGRRKPYFLVGAILSSLALVFVPYSSALWIAAGFLWIMDASINISMEPFRALVADKLPESQRSYGFVIQTLIIGVGTWVASNLPWFLSFLGISNEAGVGQVPPSVKWGFFIGAFIFLGSILWTIFTTKEDAPEDMDQFIKEKNESRGLWNGVVDIAKNFAQMPAVMWKLGVVQFFSWFAFFTMWSFAVPALTEHVYQSPMPLETDALFALKNEQYNNAANLVGSSMGMYGLSSMAFALVLTFITAKRIVNRRMIHFASLLAGGVGFMLLFAATKEYAQILNLSFALIGLSWGSILSMPYAILSSSVKPEKMGVSMGIFNMFIVIPQIVAALGGINWAYKTFLGEQIIYTMVLAGISLLLGALTCFLLPNRVSQR